MKTYAPGGSVSIKRWVGGMDQTSFMAELQGALTAFSSAQAAGVPIHLILDNKSVLPRVAARLRGERPLVQYCGGSWRKLEATVFL